MADNLNGNGRPRTSYYEEVRARLAGEAAKSPSGGSFYEAVRARVEQRQVHEARLARTRQPHPAESGLVISRVPVGRPGTGQSVEVPPVDVGAFAQGMVSPEQSGRILKGVGTGIQKEGARLYPRMMEAGGQVAEAAGLTAQSFLGKANPLPLLLKEGGRRTMERAAELSEAMAEQEGPPPQTRQEMQEASAERIGETIAGFASAPLTIPASLGKAFSAEVAGLLGDIHNEGAPYEMGKAAEEEAWNLIAGVIPPIGAAAILAEELAAAPTPEAKREVLDRYARTEAPALLGAVGGIAAGGIRNIRQRRAERRAPAEAADAAEQQRLMTATMRVVQSIEGAEQEALLGLLREGRVEEAHRRAAEIARSRELTPPGAREAASGNRFEGIVNNAGKPMPLYHGTRADFAIGEWRPGVGGAAGPGIYLSKTPELASTWAGDRPGARVIRVYARGRYLRLPYSEVINAPKWAAKAKREGYSGLDTGIGEVVVFDPKDIVVIPERAKAASTAESQAVALEAQRGPSEPLREAGPSPTPAEAATPPETARRRAVPETRGESEAIPPAVTVYRGQTVLPFDPSLESGRYPGLVHASESPKVASYPYAEGTRGNVTKIVARPRSTLDLTESGVLVGTDAILREISSRLGKKVGGNDLASTLKEAGYDSAKWIEAVPGMHGPEITWALAKDLVPTTHSAATDVIGQRVLRRSGYLQERRTTPRSPEEQFAANVNERWGLLRRLFGDKAGEYSKLREQYGEMAEGDARDALGARINAMEADKPAELVRALNDTYRIEKMGEPPEITLPDRPPVPETPSRRLISDEQAAASKDAIKQHIRDLASGTKPTAGLDPTVLAHAARLGAYYLESGVRDFSEWSRRMVEDIGEEIRPHLLEIYGAARGFRPENYPALGPPPGDRDREGGPPGETPEQAYRAAEKILEPSDKTIDVSRYPGNIARRAATAFRNTQLSEFVPIREVEIALHRAEGKPVPRFGVHSKLELVRGARNKADAELIEFRRQVEGPLGDLAEPFEKYVMLRRIQDRLLDNPDVKQVEGWSLDRVDRALEGQRRKHGDAAMEKMRAIAEGPFQKLADQVLERYQDAGILSPEDYAYIKEHNPFYAKFDVIRDITEENRQAPEGIGRRIASGADPIKAIRGIHKENFKLRGILRPQAEQIVTSVFVSEKNAKMVEAVDPLINLDAEGRYISRVPFDKSGNPVGHPKPGYERVYYFKDGVRTGIEVPKWFAESLQGLNRGQTEFMARFLMHAASPMRWGTVMFNMGFQVANLFLADLPAFTLHSRYGYQLWGHAIPNPWDAVRFANEGSRAFWDSFTGNMTNHPTEGYVDFLRSGAGFSTISKVLLEDSFQPRNALPETHLSGRALQHFKATTLDTLAKAASVLEETTKILAYRRGVRIEGLDRLPPHERIAKLNEIASEVRLYGGSPDFARSGTWRSLNYIYMFLNARKQGIARIGPRLFTDREASADAWVRMGYLTLPITMLAMENMSEENREDYEKVPQWERDNYFIIFKSKDRPDAYFTNEDGEKVRDTLIRIQKREIVKMLANTTEAAVKFAHDRDPEAVGNMFWSLAEEMVPVNIQGKDLTERGESVISGLNPALKTPFEFFTGRDTWRHRPTVPEGLQRYDPAEQYYPGRMHPAFVWLGQKTGVSPLKWKQVARNMTGQLVTQFMVDEPLEGRPAISEYPVFERFFRSTYIDHSKFYEAYRDAEQAYSTLGKFYREGREDEAREYEKKNRHRLEAYFILRPAYQALTKFRSAARQADAREQEFKPGITPSEFIDPAMERLKEVQPQ